MKRSAGSFILMVVLLLTAPVTAYEAWQAPVGVNSEYLEEYEDILFRFTTALNRAVAAQAAHPQFLFDLEGLQQEFADLLYRWQLDAPVVVDYSSVTNVPDLTGTYSIVHHSSHSTLIINHRGSVITGELYNDEIKDGRIEADGSLYFIRSGPNQVWTGTISTTSEGKLRLSGTIDCPVTGQSGVFWEAIQK